MPQISVIVPVYRVEAYLDRCVTSILNQTFRDLELILVDDGSPDNCGALCDAYGRADSRVRVIHQKNGGLSAARNAGIDWVFANSDSQWLTFIDSDDWVHPEMLRRLLDGSASAAMGRRRGRSQGSFRSLWNRSAGPQRRFTWTDSSMPPLPVPSSTTEAASRSAAIRWASSMRTNF